MWTTLLWRISLSLAIIAALTTVVIADQPVPQIGNPLAGLTADQLTNFQAGQDEFQSIETPTQGLGPVFNEASCAVCHTTLESGAPAVGGSTGRLETRFGRIFNGAFDPMISHGGSLLQDRGIGSYDGYDFVAETVPDGAFTAGRRTTPLFGLGLVDAVPDQTFKALAQLERMLDLSTAGTVAMVYNISAGKNTVGKFGWKDQNPTLFQFSGDAYLNEMGVTNPQFPNENCPDGDCAPVVAHNPAPGLNDDGTDVQKFTDFMTLLAPPPRGPVTAETRRGEFLFMAIGCANCHMPMLITGPHQVAALDRKVFQPFSDFLLHDMGSLGDRIVQGPAGGTMMRTAPLWGLRFETKLLHDGRAADPQAAILAHDGQGKKARNRFAGLSSQQKTELLAFLNSL
jgi:CxxC motif-containing protein (DUF1111 family)